MPIKEFATKLLQERDALYDNSEVIAEVHVSDGDQEFGQLWDVKAALFNQLAGALKGKPELLEMFKAYDNANYNLDRYAGRKTFVLGFLQGAITATRRLSRGEIR